MRSKTCRDCHEPIELVYAPILKRWIALDVESCHAGDPAAWLVIRGGLQPPTASRLPDLAEKKAAVRGISLDTAKAELVMLMEAHFEHRQTCLVRQAREARRR